MGFIILRLPMFPLGPSCAPAETDFHLWSEKLRSLSTIWRYLRGLTIASTNPSFFLPFTRSTQEVWGSKQFQTFFSRLSNLSHCWFMLIDVPAWQHYLHGGVVLRPCSFHAPSSNLCRIELKNGKAPLSTTKVITWESGRCGCWFQHVSSPLSHWSLANNEWWNMWRTVWVTSVSSQVAEFIILVETTNQGCCVCFPLLRHVDDIPTSWCTERRRRPKHQFRGHTPAISWI